MKKALTTATLSLAFAMAPASAHAATATAVALGDHHTCAILTAGSVKCWGDNGYGQLGLGDSSFHNVPGLVSLPAQATRIGAGGAFTCAASATRAWCWGENGQGQLGIGDDMPAYTAPQEISGLTGSVTALAVGASHACIATRPTPAGSDTISCWGNNAWGQAGAGSAANALSPVVVGGVTTGQVKQLTAGGSSSCALLTAGSVTCWGGSSRSPKTVSGLSSVKRIAQGSHLCALLNSGKVKCVGPGTFGQLGDGKARTSSSPVSVTGLTGITDLSAGPNHTCAIKTDGKLYCWGDNIERQTTNSSSASRKTPVANGVTNVKSVGGGLYHSCAVLKTGSVKCWGNNVAGQLGSYTQTGWLVTAGI